MKLISNHNFTISCSSIQFGGYCIKIGFIVEIVLVEVSTLLSVDQWSLFCDVMYHSECPFEGACGFTLV